MTLVTDECRCSSCESGCLPANCGNGKCRATGACVDNLPVVESPSIAPWPWPTPEMLNDSEFNAIWETIKSWDVNVPELYRGYMGATGNHARRIFDAIRATRSRSSVEPAPNDKIITVALYAGSDGNTHIRSTSEPISVDQHLAMMSLPVVASPPLVPELPRTVIGFTSSIFQSGKSEAARYLTERYGFQRGRFAGALKAMLRAFLSYRGVDPDTIERMIEGDLKEVPSVHLNSRTPRHAMQTLGHEWGRQAIDFNLWVDTEMDAKAGVSLLVFDDVRYPNEVSAIRNAGGIIIMVERPGTDQGAAAGHASEGQYLNHDLVISNDSTIEAFRAKIDDVLKAKSVVTG